MKKRISIIKIRRLADRIASILASLELTVAFLPTFGIHCVLVTGLGLTGAIIGMLLICFEGIAMFIHSNDAIYDSFCEKRRDIENRLTAYLLKKGRIITIPIE